LDELGEDLGEDGRFDPELQLGLGRREEDE
jgi:hypothetical protein